MKVQALFDAKTITNFQVYNGCLTTMDQLGRLGDIPAPLQPAYKVYNLCLLIFSCAGLTFSVPHGSLNHIDRAKMLLSNLRFQECVGANPGKRPSPQDVITKLRRSPGFFKNDLIDIVLFLEELQIKEEGDKSRFFTSLPGLLDNCPTNVCQVRNNLCLLIFR